MKIKSMSNEICQKADLHEFKETIEVILTEIHESDCLISCFDISGVSVLEQPKDGKNRIRIGLKNKKPIHIIWGILHEFGHHLSGTRMENDTTIYREEKAWEIATELVKKHPQLLGHLDDYNAYQEMCLDSYRKNVLRK